jgi:hypothetical protein
MSPSRTDTPSHGARLDTGKAIGVVSMNATITALAKCDGYVVGGLRYAQLGARKEKIVPMDVFATRIASEALQ